MGREEDIRLGRLALEKGMITPDQLQYVLNELQQLDGEGTLEDLLLANHFLTTPQAQNLHNFLDQQNKVGDYRILAKLGEGGMGAVYKALHETTGEVRALKILNPDLSKDQQIVLRFIREAETCILLNHPNIVRSFEIQKYKNTFYIAMEFIEGISLDEYIHRKGNLAEEEALVICRKVAQALKMAHTHGIIHRDIKPENILISKAGEIKLTDFGLAKVKTGTQMSLTQTGLFLGTPSYISPEQAKGEKTIDIRSDFYSLGITLFHMLTGNLPFDSDSALVVCQMHLMEPLPDPQKFNKGLSPACKALLKCLSEKEPHLRPQNPDELIAMIDGTLKGDLTATGRMKVPTRSLKGKNPAQKTTTLPQRLPSRGAAGASSSPPPSLTRWVGLFSMGVVLIGLVFFLMSLSSKSSSSGAREEVFKAFREVVERGNFVKADQLLDQNPQELIPYEKSYRGLKKDCETFAQLLKKHQWSPARKVMSSLVQENARLLSEKSPLVSDLQKAWTVRVDETLRGLKKEVLDSLERYFFPLQIDKLRQTSELEKKKIRWEKSFLELEQKDLLTGLDSQNSLERELGVIRGLLKGIDPYLKALQGEKKIRNFSKIFSEASSIIGKMGFGVRYPSWDYNLRVALETWERAEKWALFHKEYLRLNEQRDYWKGYLELFEGSGFSQWLSSEKRELWQTYRDFQKNLKEGWEKLALRLKKEVNITGELPFSGQKITRVALGNNSSSYVFFGSFGTQKGHREALSSLPLADVASLPIDLPYQMAWAFYAGGKKKFPQYQKPFLLFYQKLPEMEKWPLFSGSFPPEYRARVKQFEKWAQEWEKSLAKKNPPVKKEPDKSPPLQRDHLSPESLEFLKRIYGLYMEGKWAEGYRKIQSWKVPSSGEEGFKESFESYLFLVLYFCHSERLYKTEEKDFNFHRKRFFETHKNLLLTFPDLGEEIRGMVKLHEAEQARKKGSFHEASKELEIFLEKCRETALFRTRKDALKLRLNFYALIHLCQNPGDLKLSSERVLQFIEKHRDLLPPRWSNMARNLIRNPKVMEQISNAMAKRGKVMFLMVELEEFIKSLPKEEKTMALILRAHCLNLALLINLGFELDADGPVSPSVASFSPFSTSKVYQQLVKNAKIQKEKSSEAPKHSGGNRKNKNNKKGPRGGGKEGPMERLSRLIKLDVMEMTILTWHWTNRISVPRDSKQPGPLPRGFDFLSTDLWLIGTAAHLFALNQENKISQRWLKMGLLNNLLIFGKNPARKIGFWGYFGIQDFFVKESSLARRLRAKLKHLEVLLIESSPKSKNFQDKFVSNLPQDSPYFFFLRGDGKFASSGFWTGESRALPSLIQIAPGGVKDLKIHSRWAFRDKGRMELILPKLLKVIMFKKDKFWHWTVENLVTGETLEKATANSTQKLFIHLSFDYKIHTWQLASPEVSLNGKIPSFDSPSKQEIRLFMVQGALKKMEAGINFSSDDLLEGIGSAKKALTTLD